MGHLFDLTLLDLSDATGQAISEFFPALHEGLVHTVIIY